ncbi:MAG: LysR substrate-binding domain-containing protein [Actinomycetota bacterium]|nr:LysR substrate-binding domain-containing protein [Actinomycetota bacterium]
MLDVKRMSVLREVVRRGSFSAAADSLHLSQSAVSQQVAALEREVGLQLLERTSEGPRLTSAGERLVSHADAVIARLDEAERELTEIAGLEGGRLRLISFPTASATLMTLAMSEFKQRHPQIELQFAEGEPEESVPAVKRGEFDIALAFDYVDVPTDHGRDIESELIYRDPMRVALPPGHPLAASEKVRIADLADEDWLCGDQPSSCRDHVISACRSAGFEPKISFESDDYQVIQGLVAAGLGVGLLPTLAYQDPKIELREIAGEEPIRRVWAVSRNEESRSPAAEEMLAILRTVGANYGRDSGLRAAA